MTHPLPLPVIAGPIDARVRPPGSKSETIRALAAASLAGGRSHLYEPLRADDPLAMCDALRALGVPVASEGDPWTVPGSGGRFRAPEGPLEVGESGLSARILLAMAGFVSGTVRIVGRGRLPERPMGGIVDVLRAQGVEVSGDRIPIEVTADGWLAGGRIEVDCSESSQFASAVMLVAPVMSEPVLLDVVGLAGSAGYLDITESTMRRFGAGITRTVTGYEIANDGYQAADVVIEADASAAVYPMGIAAVTGGRVVIDGLGADSRQPDLRIASVLGEMGCEVQRDSDSITIDARGVQLRPLDVDLADAPDGALALAVICLYADGVSRISGLGSLRHKESDRLSAISSEIGRIGGQAEVEEDTLVIGPGTLRAAEMDSHGDHRIAMAMAIAGVTLPGSRMGDAGVVSKTWPGFWDLVEDLSTG